MLLSNIYCIVAVECVMLLLPLVLALLVRACSCCESCPCCKQELTQRRRRQSWCKANGFSNPLWDLLVFNRCDNPSEKTPFREGCCAC